MSVYKRDYLKELKKRPTGETVWAYAFCFRKQRYRASGFKTKHEAELAEQKARKEVILEGRVLKPFQSVEFETLGKEVLRHRESTCAPMTVLCESHKLKALAKDFRGMPVHKLTAADVSRFIARRKREGISNRTVNMCMNFLRVMYKHALMHGYATYNPMTEIKNLHEPFRDRPVLSRTDFIRLLDEATRVDDPEFLVTWLKVRAYTGVRPSECVYLKWKDVDFGRDQIIVRPKNGNPLKDGEFRAIPIAPALRPVLIEWKRRWDEVMDKIGRPHDWIFFHPSFPEQRALGYRRSFERACKNAGLPDTTSYHLRHFFLSECVMSGCDLMVITKWAGHGSVRMLEKVYAHLAPRYHADQIAKVGFGQDGAQALCTASVGAIAPTGQSTMSDSSSASR